MVVEDGTTWLVGLSILAPGWTNSHDAGSSTAPSLAQPQSRLFVRLHHYADFIRVTVEVRFGAFYFFLLSNASSPAWAIFATHAPGQVGTYLEWLAVSRHLSGSVKNDHNRAYLEYPLLPTL